jgi:hypothetical protein
MHHPLSYSISASCCTEVSRVHSFPSQMQPKIVHSLLYFKMTINHLHCNMFRPYKAIFRQLFINTRDTRPTSENYTRRGAKHGSRKMKITRRQETVFILKHILVRTTICNSMGCIDIRTSAVRQFQLVNNCLKMAS